MKTVYPGSVVGRVRAPTSKSVFQRAVAIASQASGPSTIHHGSLSADCQAALDVARGLGARITTNPHSVRIEPGSRMAETVDCGEAGLTLRMFAPIAALGRRLVELDAGGSLRHRPMGMVQQALEALHARCDTCDGRPPLRVQGPLRGDAIVIDGSETSQLLTGLLIALPLSATDSRVHVKNLVSKPYIHLTLDLLRQAGIRIQHDSKLSLFDIPGGQKPAPLDLRVEGDWSGAAFLLVAGALAGDLAVLDLSCQSSQADTAVLEALRRAGAQILCKPEAIRISSTDLGAFEIDLSDCPDIFPPLAALACSCNGQTRLAGVHRLHAKESDRAAVLCSELSTLGAQIRIDGDNMLIMGGPLTGGTVTSHNDHRMAMAMAVAALRADGPVQIHGDEAVAKSYPHFFADLQSLGVKIS